MPPNAMKLFFKLCALIRARKWKDAYQISDQLKAVMAATDGGIST